MISVTIVVMSFGTEFVMIIVRWVVMIVVMGLHISSSVSGVIVIGMGVVMSSTVMVVVMIRGTAGVMMLIMGGVMMLDMGVSGDRQHWGGN